MKPLLAACQTCRRISQKKGLEPFRSEAAFFKCLFVIALFCCFCVPRRYCVIRVAHSAADIHETAATAIVRGASTPRMIREAGSRGNETSNDDVFLQAPQVILQAPHRRLGEDAGGFL